MPGSTPLGIPYPIGTDRVSDGDNAIQAVASYLDSSITWGACYANSYGPGADTTGWVTNNILLGGSPGVVLNPQGIVLPRTGYYHLIASAQITFTQDIAAWCQLFIGNPVAGVQWAISSVEHTTAQNPLVAKPAIAQTAGLLAAGTVVGWGLTTAGTSSGWNNQGAQNNFLMVRLLHATP